MLGENEKLVLSVDNKKQGFSVKNFFNMVDNEISSKKYDNNTKDDIKVISTDGSEKIYIDGFSQELEGGFYEQNKIITGYSEEFDMADEYDSSVNKKDSSILPEKSFTNRKQIFTAKKLEAVTMPVKVTNVNETVIKKINEDTVKAISKNSNLFIKSSSDTEEENKVDRLIANKLLKKPALNDLVNTPENSALYELVNNPVSEQINNTLEEKLTLDPVEESNFEEGLKARLAHVAEERLNDFSLTPEERINKCNDFYAKVLYPLFAHLEESLDLYNRKANLNVNTFMISLDVRYKDKIEYKYQVQILGVDSYPVLEIKVSDLVGQLVIRNNLTNTSIDKVSREDLFQDFLHSYQKHLHQATAN